jgi:predicted Zn-dependent protease with MMP-like domain
MITAEEREFFEEELERVLAELPPLVKRLIEEVPLVVDDVPSKRLCKSLGVEYAGELCGLYTGVSLDKKSVEISGAPPDTVYLFRDGILNAAMDEAGEVTPERLREEIRLTILHEYGHHHGMDEDELEALGY